MSLESLLTATVQTFIHQNIEADVAVLALQKNKLPEADWPAVLNQISAKQKAKSKLPTWFQTDNVLYPSKLSIEQSSSEKTAAYKAGLINGSNLIDLTGGFGVDDYYFAHAMRQVVHCELNEELSSIVQHNFEVLKKDNIKCLAGDSTTILQQLKQSFDWIYIDPSRRNDTKGKVFMLQDCLPNVPKLLDFYFEYTINIMIKTAPILDISAGLLELQHVKTVHIIAVDNEVKELLWVLEKEYTAAVTIIAVNITKEATETFAFETSDKAVINYALPKKYLYEPNAAIMKSGGFEAVALQFGLEKLHQHSHLYTSEALIPFPGRVFVIEQNSAYDKTSMKALLENKKANITTRNFPDSVEIIRKKWRIKDGGSLYCFFTTDINNHKIVLLCSKIK